ncbi:type II toxin-antitoxin system RelB/DinJ family antitoxin [Megamonas hypermegale]|uniref:type II toxin-antitoxin system RelB/DinJ family antitoxin n=1 Tax=Megamonas hypermegale TaxID=158847 RepID=UPI0025A327B7|nr:type II toxin-antitoxin system RelB/DinJ family antitoxin [Megamonas hypermegale]MDM8143195.1 type II toxin-antitoxin system RelB/DinJ family antitoxin [Megamonas hypermegale]
MATTSMNIRIDSDLKKNMEAIFSELGLTTSAAFTIFAKAVVRNEGIPFELTLRPNAETLQAMDDALYGRNLSKAYDNIKDLRAALDAED